MRITLERHESGDQGTFGRIVLPARVLFTGELPDRGNAPNLSCIPAAVYECVFSWSPHLRRLTYEVLKVQARAGIRIHPANLMGDSTKGFRCQLNGCIALGERLGILDGQKAILISEPAVQAFQDFLARQPFTLEIVNVDT